MSHRPATFACVLASLALVGCYQGIEGFDSIGSGEDSASTEHAESSENPDEGSEDPDAGGEDPDAGSEDPDAGSEDPDAGGEDPPPDPDPDPDPDPTPSPASCGFDLVWPTTGSASVQTVVHDAYGPRVLDAQFDWHHGIDWPGHPEDGEFADPIYAIADGPLYAVGNQLDPEVGAIASYGASAGSVLVIEHPGSELGPGAPTLYSVYMHLDTLALSEFWARIGDAAPGPVDLHEYYYLGGPGTTDDNRGRRRPTLASSGDPITDYPHVDQSQVIARIGDSGASYEHLHFELREGTPTSAGVHNPYAYLPHLNQALHHATLSVEPGLLRARIEIPREPGALAATTDLAQQLDVEEVAVQILAADDTLVDELRLSFFAVGQLDNPDQGELELEGVEIRLWPDDFTSAVSVWGLELEFSQLELAGLVPGPGERYALEVTDVCGNRIQAQP